MTVLLKILSILGCTLLVLLLTVLLLTLLLFFSKVKVFIKYRQELEIHLGVFFFKLNVTHFAPRRKSHKRIKIKHFSGELFDEFPQKEKKEKKKAKTKPVSHAASKTPAKQKKSVSEILELIQSILTDISLPVSKCADVRIHSLYVTAGAKEAADTAILFGHFNTAVSSLILICEKFRSLYINKENVGVYSDFLSDKPTLDTNIELDFSVRHISLTAFTIFRSYLKNK